MPVSRSLLPLRSASGDWLDALPKQVLREPPGLPAPPLPAVWREPLVLMGVVSSTVERRELLRCTWVNALRATGGARIVFVVGEGNFSDGSHADVLAVPIGEQLLSRKQGGRVAKKIRGATSYSTYSLYAKTMRFLRYAAEQPEPAVALADDDVFVVPQALLSYVWSLMVAARGDGPPFGGGGASEWYAGRFDWYSWRTETMQATAYWRGLRGALYGASEPYRNCSPTGNGWVYQGKRAVREAAALAPGQERCVGPFAFTKGPLTLLSTPVVRWLVASAAFARDTERAEAIANGTLTPRGKSTERFPQDVQLGYWLASHPALRYVSIPRKTSWADAFVEVSDLHRLLVAHRVPWDQFAWLQSRTQQLWSTAAHAGLHFVCAGAPCPPGQCAHARGQVSCAAELMLSNTSRDGGPMPPMGCSACDCWEGVGNARASSGGVCNFSRAYVPQLPAHCARRAPPSLRA